MSDTLTALSSFTSRLERLTKTSLICASVSSIGALAATGVCVYLALNPIEITRVYAVDPWGNTSIGNSRLVVSPTTADRASFAVAYLRDLREKTSNFDANVRRVQRAMLQSTIAVQEGVVAWLDRVDHDGLAARMIEISSIEEVAAGRLRISWIEHSYSSTSLLASDPYVATLLVEEKPNQDQTEDLNNIHGLVVTYLNWSPTLPEIANAS